jgi:SAM-dependent methyltransferase
MTKRSGKSDAAVRATFKELADYAGRIFRRGPSLPPKRLRDVGSGDFKKIGEEFFGYFLKFCHLDPMAHVFEIGCGCGRMALPLTGYLHEKGRYVGMDIAKAPVVWCRAHISVKYPNFEFRRADLQNARYNPGGRFSADDYVFPFADESFDFIFLTSVLTHMLPGGVENYLKEISRLLKTNGRVLMTLFLLNEMQRTLGSQGKRKIDFPFNRGVCRVSDERVPESAVAYEEDHVRNLLNRHGLIVREPIRYGTWSGRTDGLSLQDLVIAFKGGLSRAEVST